MAEGMYGLGTGGIAEGESRVSLQGLREEWKGSSGGRSQQSHPTAPEAFRGLYRAGLRKKKNRDGREQK